MPKATAVTIVDGGEIDVALSKAYTRLRVRYYPRNRYSSRAIKRLDISVPKAYDLRQVCDQLFAHRDDGVMLCYHDGVRADGLFADHVEGEVLFCTKDDQE